MFAMSYISLIGILCLFMAWLRSGSTSRIASSWRSSASVPCLGARNLGECETRNQNYITRLHVTTRLDFIYMSRLSHVYKPGLADSMS